MGKISSDNAAQENKKQNEFDIDQPRQDAADNEFIEELHLKKRPVKLNRIYNCKITTDGETREISVFIIEITEKLIRLTNDYEIPTDRDFNMEIKLDQDTLLETPARVDWKKEMFGETYMMGIQILDTPEKSRIALDKFIEDRLKNDRRRAYRLERVLSVDVCIDQTGEKISTTSADISKMGLRLLSPVPLPFDNLVTLKIKLDLEEKPVIVKGKIRWQMETAEKRYSAGIEIIEISEKEAARIDSFVSRAIEGELDKIDIELPPIEELIKPTGKTTDILKNREE